MININISDSATKLNSLNRRMFILATAKIIILGGIVSRLFFLQVKENKKYLTLSDKNRIREWKLPPIRGEFQDYFGNTIAGNFEAYQLHIIPEEVEDFRYVIYRVKELLELSDKQFKKIVKKKNEIKPWETLIVADNLSWEKFSKINNHLYDLNGVKPVISISRDYPYKENFTHVLGYVSQANENDLLTNENIKEKAGSICVMDIYTGAIIAMHSSPSFDPNSFVFGISQDEWQLIRNNPMKPVVNKSLS